MPESIDWPRIQSPLRRRRFLLLILAVLAVIFFGGRTALSYYVDVLWFGSLGYRDVLWKTLSLQWGIFAVFAAVTFLILFGSFLALKRAHLRDLPSGHTIFIAGQPLRLQVEPVMRFIALGLSLGIAAITGAGMMVEWPTIALFWYAPHSDRGCQRRDRGARTLGCGGSSSGCAVLYLPSGGPVVRQQLYRETERAGSRAAVYCPQYRADAAGLRIGWSIATRVSR